MKLTTLLPVLGILVSGHFLTPDAKADHPVLLIIANDNFDFDEYASIRRVLEAARIEVKVAAATTTRAIPAPNPGQLAGSDGGVVPDLSLREVRSGDYSAIAFVGGWGASMYQYAFNDPNFDGRIDNYYHEFAFNGDDSLGDGRVAETKVVVNTLINEFLAADKPVAGICHGVTVLAWARVNGVSPLQGRKVASGANVMPANTSAYFTDDYSLTVAGHVVVNGGFTNPFTGQAGNPNTAADDVIVDGRIITAESPQSAAHFGKVIARQVAGRGKDLLVGGFATGR